MNKYQLYLKNNVDLIALENAEKEEFEAWLEWVKLKQKIRIEREVFNWITEQKWRNWFI